MNKNFLFDGEEVRFTVNRGEISNKNENVPTAFIQLLVDMEKEISSYYYDKNQGFYAEYLPTILKPDLDNPGSYLKPGGREQKLTVPYLFKEEDGGDGQIHDVTYYQRVRNDDKSKESINGKLYVTYEGITRYNFKGNLHVDKGEIHLAVYLKYFCTGLGVDYFIDDKIADANKKKEVRDLFRKALNIIDDENLVKEKDLRQLCSGIFQIPNTYKLSVVELKDELSGRVEAYNNIPNKEKAKDKLRQFIKTVKGDGTLPHKAFVGKAIEYYAVVIKRVDSDDYAYLNTNSVEKPLPLKPESFGEQLFKLRAGRTLFDELYDFIYERGNKDVESKIKGWLKEGKKDDVDPELKQLRAEYFNLTQKEAPEGMNAEMLDNEIAKITEDNEKTDEKEVELEILREEYFQKFSKKVPWNMHNKPEWIKEKING